MVSILIILAIYLASFSISKLIKVSVTLKLLKDLADEGYKLDLSKLEDNNSKQNILKHIPGVNIIDAITEAKTYDKFLFIEELKLERVLIPLTKKEERRYKKSRDFLTAFIINTREVYDKDERRITTEDSKINFIEENGNIFITKVEGKAKDLPPEEQRHIVISEVNKIKEKERILNEEIEEIKKEIEEKKRYLEEYYGIKEEAKLTRKRKNHL